MNAMDLSGLVRLSFLDLRGNRLPALAGLHDCGAMLQLALDGNRLTRLSECPAGAGGRGEWLLMGPAHSPTQLPWRRVGGCRSSQQTGTFSSTQQ